ncbi:MAG: hypothetical protein FWC61_00930 [Proteobacteria bacterium]|nr:hypothetical protein [Pseudomonadota bacterium]
MKFKTILLKSIPYVLSVAGGIVVYILSVDNTNDTNLLGLMSNVAASLLAIPLIFLLYEYVNYKISSNVNEKLAESMTFDVNSIVLKLLKDLRIMLNIRQPLNWKTIQKMLRMKAPEIKRAAKITDKDIEFLKAHKKLLNEITYKVARANVLSDRQIQLIIQITKSAAYTVNEWEYKGDTAQIPKYLEALLDAIDNWFDSCERESVRSHQQFQLTVEQEISDRVTE